MRDISVDVFFDRVNKYPHTTAYCGKNNGHYKPTSWSKFGEDVRSFALGLMALGLKKGQCVCTLSFNRPEWVTGSIATQAAGGVCVGVYNTCSPEEISYILQHSEAPFMLVENGHRWRNQVEPALANTPALKKIILMEPDDLIQNGQMTTYSQVIELGKKQQDDLLEERMKSIETSDPATFIYTSGTTGAPKAVELSHKAVDWTVKSAVNLLKVSRDDSLLSYLPLAHVAEKMFTIYAPIYSGMKIYYATSVEHMPDDLKEVQPTIFFGVPRVYEKFHAKVADKLSQAKGVKALLLKWAQKTAKGYWECHHAGKMISPFLHLQYIIAKKLVFNKLKPLLGLGKARACVTGAAPISPEILEFFLKLDVPIYEVYGQSEDSGPTTFNLPRMTKLGTVGKPLPGVELKIADDGEILVRGPHLFTGYYKDKAATDEALQNGWLCSGDVGEIDKDGYLKITDRKKDLLITAGGKNISPQNLEAMLKQIPLVSLALVAGDRKKFLVALLTPDEEGMLSFAQKMGIKERDLNKLVEHKLVKTEIQTEIGKINKKLANVEQIKKFWLLGKDFSVEEGELTPTLKIKRKVINTRYQDTIESMYA